ncbi:hypothetical protein GH810_02875 [Acetobacterium paludosum]|uniref:Uncharacterized protein n=1 Tax=Acetobacterium paludosum TaxID=52693 RepID=A0A923HT29_9FIRM|nr:hypothetical protein [Acetobacterium paludosum]MBC3887252.1 hypothetical protein [Acetobacterium paludosum]
MAYEQKKDTINGVDYTFQKVPPREWVKIRQRCKDKNGQALEEKLYDEILSHIVVTPKITMDDFEEVEDMEAVMEAAITFQCRRAETV